MDKITFLNELELALDDLPREEKDSIMHKYENLFYEEELKGISESQIIKKLNDPYHISKEVKARSAIHYASYKPTLANIVRAILASLSLGILSLFIILIPVVIIALLILLCFLISICFIFAPFVFSFTGLGIMFIVITLKIGEIIHKLILKYLLWYIKTVKGSVKE
ncbi:MAG: DUF1700 domain-containing protein [Staphylococcus epidermidis]|nr:DUF1700 domain-containing protein [Staphylococcus epidermidis]